MDENVRTKEELLLKEEKIRLRKERQKRRKYRLLLLLLLMGGTGVMLTTSTYAWFTANRNVAIQDLQVDVTASDGIQISADGSNWKSVVQTSDLEAAAYEKGAKVQNQNQLPTALVPVSTIGAVTENGYLDMYLGSLAVSDTEKNRGSYIVTATNETVDTKGKSGNFIAFDLFFKVQKETPLHLNTSSGVKDTNGVLGIQNAARIAFITEGNHVAGTDLATIQGTNIGASTTKPATVYIWEPNYDVHTAAAVANAKGAYDITTTPTGAAQIQYSGVKAPVEARLDILRKEATQTLHGDQFGNVVPDLKTEAEYSKKPPIFTLSEGITKIRIYVWVEGQDVDCEDTASGGNIKFTLSISADAEGAGA